MTNPLLSPSPLPYGLPPFARIEAAHYAEAIEAGLSEHLAEIDRIVQNPEVPTFANTAVAMEQAGRLLDRAAASFFTLVSADASPEIRELETKFSPRFSAHQDELYLNHALYERFRGIDTSACDPESARLVDEYLKEFRQTGIQLDPAGQDRLRAVNAELARLGTEFGQRVKEGMKSAALLVEDAEELAGLPADDVAAAAEAARAAGHEGQFLLGLIQPSNQPALASLTDRAVRRRLFEASAARGSNGGPLDVLDLARSTARLRAEKASLLGFANYAELVADRQTAPDFGAVQSMLNRMAPAAVRNADREAAALAESAGHPLEPWDWAYYSAKVRREKYSVDEQALRPYFELERVLRDGVFFAAGSLYGTSFHEREDLVGYHPDVRVWEVRDSDGGALGLFLGDYYSRESKRGGAWMNSLVDQNSLLGTRPVVMNTLNIAKPAPGEPTLLTLDEVRTVFHEFGHALHGLFSDVTYPRFSGTAVPRDFVEFPSQVNEMWIMWPEVLTNYARHHATGEPLPQDVVDRLEESRLWGEGFATTEYLGAALLDLAWHVLEQDAVPDDALAFEAKSLAAAGIAHALIPPRYRTGYFQHIFAGAGYAAGYYSYIWSEVLDAETVDWFTENGGLTRANGDRFRQELLSRGNSRDPLESFRILRGRDAKLEPLLKRRGLE
ncbi:Peptidyl-dipeptidase Dcp [Pseudarthrobacter chlorophenolicus A6]|uniref:Peptidyl-dipeptidase Dcp n=1 Tax=Pseudarthrobacter chlorophenolicus (strain ATCC 700700 / DSM 12829 / CIP 107037 / JCM 12360 / KCTC 9906 / NCIMB 13794 / A6) TaxID=452863 RepID=B8H9E4_PSECP|nr:M3 family metallopeptidase [Pseudarthrobacter chlorophenolicus]ACL40013.1 Peptidyl-dipeptidase Dcp [Pseudarthrobacter chlorophenolicus A6]SDQ89584.1 peptidyl-dipeptidase Dcp [Pseudarthrobacter chlorophenolicus]